MIHPTLPVFYCVNEVADGTVTSINFSPNFSNFKKLNSKSTLGGAPCNMDITKDGNFLVVANYNGLEHGVVVYELQEDGKLGQVVQTLGHKGGSDHYRQD